MYVSVHALSSVQCYPHESNSSYDTKQFPHPSPTHLPIPTLWQTLIHLPFLKLCHLKMLYKENHTPCSLGHCVSAPHNSLGLHARAQLVYLIADSYPMVWVGQFA